MAGFFKKLLGKKNLEEAPSNAGGSWAEHEISVEVQEHHAPATPTEKPVEAKTEKSTETLVSAAPTKPTKPKVEPVELTLPQAGEEPPFNQTIEIEVQPPGPPKTLPDYVNTADLASQKSQKTTATPTKPIKTVPPTVPPTDLVQTATVKPLIQKKVDAAPDIATIKNSDLKFAMDQVEPEEEENDPLSEITAQIQSELAAEKTQKQKKLNLEKLIEITSQLKRPDFGDDFEV